MSQAPNNPPYQAAGGPQTAPEERTYAMFTHLVPLIAHVGGPFVTSFIAALIMWQIKKEQSPFLDDHGRESANFQLSVLIYALLVVPVATLLTCGIGAFLFIPLIIVNIVACIQAARAAHRGDYFRYPMCLRFF